MSTNLVNVEPRKLGPDGPELHAIGYGMWRTTGDDVGANQALLEDVLDAGINLIDQADVYGLDHGGTGFGQNEERLGNVLAVAPALRDRMVLATKGGIMPPLPYDSSATYLRSAVDASLRRLQVDHIDLYQIHRPDMFTHPSELAGVLEELHAAGKIGMIGISNYSIEQFDALRAHLSLPIVSTQPEFSVAHLEPMRDGMFDRAMQYGMVPITWSPLAGGRLLSGEGVPSELLDTLDRLAEREDVDRATLAYAFVLAHPSRPVVLLGTQNPDRIRSAARAANVSLDRNDVYDIVAASEGAPLP